MEKCVHLFGIFLPKHFQRMGCPKICLLQATGEEDDHRGHQRHHLHHRQHHRRHQLHGHCAEDHLRTSVKGWAIHTNQKAMSKLSFFITAYILGMKGNEPNFGQTIYSSRFGSKTFNTKMKSRKLKTTTIAMTAYTGKKLKYWPPLPTRRSL